MIQENRETTPNRKEEAQNLLRLIEKVDMESVKNLSKKFAEQVKPVLAQRATQLADLGFFPITTVVVSIEEGRRVEKPVPLLEIGRPPDYEPLTAVILDAKGKIYFCNLLGLDLMPNWGSREEVNEFGYTEFSLIALDSMAKQIRRELNTI